MERNVQGITDILYYYIAIESSGIWLIPKLQKRTTLHYTPLSIKTSHPMSNI